MLTKPRNDLNAQQRAVRQLALKQLQAAAMNLQTLLDATREQGDRVALRVAQGDVANACALLTEWFGCELIEGEEIGGDEIAF